MTVINTSINPLLSTAEKMQVQNHLPKGLRMVQISTNCPKHGISVREVVSIIADTTRHTCPKCKAEQDEADRLARLAKQYSIRAEQSGITHYKPFDTWQVNDERMERILSFAQSYTQDPQGNLIFSGVTGTGKTLLANLIATTFIKRDKSVRVIRSSDINNQIRATWNKNSPITEQELMNLFISRDLLVIDEFGEADNAISVETRQADRERLSRIIDGRYAKGLPTIITTNLTKEQIIERLGDRAWDRLQQHAVFIAFSWKSYRQANSKFMEI